MKCLCLRKNDKYCPAVYYTLFCSMEQLNSYDPNSKGISYTAAIFMLLSFVVAGFVVSGILSAPFLLGGSSLTDIKAGKLSTASANALRVVQIISSIVALLIPAVLTAYLLNRNPLDLLGFKRNIEPRKLGLTIVIILAALGLSAGLGYLSYRIPFSTEWAARFTKMENDYIQQVKAIISLKTPLDYINGLFVMAFLPALCEETLFRGGFQNFVTKATHKPWLSIIVVSLAFSAVHFSAYGFLSRFALGMVLGLLYQYSGNIWYNIIAHFVNNALAITAVYIDTLKGKPIETSLQNDEGTIWGLLTLPLIIFLFIIFRRVNRKSEFTIPEQNSTDVF